MKPNTKWQMMFDGAFRPVTWMGHGKYQVHDPMRASAAVLYLADDEHVAVEVTPGEIIEVIDRPSAGRNWDVLT